MTGYDVTDEEFVATLNDDLTRAYIERMAKVGDALIVGSNSGQPLGILAMPADPIAGVRRVAARALPDPEGCDLETA